MAKMSDADKREIDEYRDRKSYFGYEDYSPSGRAAIQAFKDAGGDMSTVSRTDPRRLGGSDRRALNAAQKAQRETMNEGRRETRGKVARQELANGGLVKRQTAKSLGKAC